MSDDEPRSITEIVRNPGVTVQPMSRDEATQYILNLGIIFASLPSAMGHLDHATLTGHLHYHHPEDKKTQAEKDAFTILKALAGKGNATQRAKQPGLAEAVARMQQARTIVYG
jgi:hypothetical protein